MARVLCNSASKRRASRVLPIRPSASGKVSSQHSAGSVLAPSRRCVNARQTRRTCGTACNSGSQARTASSCSLSALESGTTSRRRLGFQLAGSISARSKSPLSHSLSVWARRSAGRVQLMQPGLPARRCLLPVPPDRAQPPGSRGQRGQARWHSQPPTARHFFASGIPRC